MAVIIPSTDPLARKNDKKHLAVSLLKRDAHPKDGVSFAQTSLIWRQGLTVQP
jgi:hypothetical protein